MRDSKGHFIKGNIEPNRNKFQTGEDHYLWKGSEVGYSALHSWLVRSFGKPDKCDDCDTIVGRIEWSNISGNYLRKREDWKKRCVPCHRRADNHPFKHGVLGLRKNIPHTKGAKKLMSEAAKENIKKRLRDKKGRLI